MLKEKMLSDSLPLVGSVCLPMVLAVVLKKGFVHQMGSWAKDFWRPLQPGSCGKEEPEDASSQA